MSDAKFEEYYKTAILPAATVNDLSDALYTKESLEWVWRAATVSTDADWRALCEKLVGVLEDISGTHGDSWQEIGCDELEAVKMANTSMRVNAKRALALAEAKLRGVV